MQLFDDFIFGIAALFHLSPHTVSIQKTKNEYDGDPCGLLDVARASIVVTSEEELDAILKYIFDNFTSDNDDCQCTAFHLLLMQCIASKILIILLFYFLLAAVERFKNRYLHPTFNGYRDGLFNLRVKLPDGRYHIVELQIHLLDIIKFKAATHKYYGMNALPVRLVF